MRRIGALEAGGTKMVMAVFNDDGSEIERITLPTETPEKTMPAMVGFFRDHAIDALGVGSFGPLDLNPASPTYGWITNTPKLAWQNYPLLTALLDGRDIPAAIDTDVNAALLAEVTSGAAQGCSNAIYITVGTGIGGGIYVNGQLVHGLLHPEVGHMLLKPRADDADQRGICPFHEGCLEGMASGPALAAKAGSDARNLPSDHPALFCEAHYLAQMCHNLIMIASPERIVLGGGVMNRKELLPIIRQETQRLLGGYIQAPALTEKINEYIVAPELYPDSGLIGAFLLGKNAYDNQ